jgi:hypothetical protein
MLMLLLKLADLTIERDIRLQLKDARGRIAHGQPTPEAMALGYVVAFFPALETRSGPSTFIFLSIARISTAKLPAFAAVKEPLSGANGDDHFAFGARHLHPPNMHLQVGLFPVRKRVSGLEKAASGGKRAEDYFLFLLRALREGAQAVMRYIRPEIPDSASAEDTRAGPAAQSRRALECAKGKAPAGGREAGPK